MQTLETGRNVGYAFVTEIFLFHGPHVDYGGPPQYHQCVGNTALFPCTVILPRDCGGRDSVCSKGAAEDPVIVFWPGLWKRGGGGSALEGTGMCDLRRMAPAHDEQTGLMAPSATPQRLHAARFCWTLPAKKPGTRRPSLAG